MTCCEICRRGPSDNVTLYRVNETGVKGIWRCWAHLADEQRGKLAIDPEEERLINILDTAGSEDLPEVHIKGSDWDAMKPETREAFCEMMRLAHKAAIEGTLPTGRIVKL